MAIVQTPQFWIRHIAIIGMVATLAACGGGGGGGNSSSDNGNGGGSGSGSVTPPPVKLDVTPDNFVFEAKNDAIPGETYTSNTITVSGINAAVPVSVSGGEYAIDNGAFTAASATVKPGQTIVVRATAAPTPVSIVNAVLTIGGVTGTYSITTLADKTAPTAEFMFPPPVSMTDGATVLVRGVASDDYSKITAVTVNGNPVETTDNFATWQVRISLKPGEDNPLVVETTDALGNSSTNAAEVMVRHGAITDAFPDAFPDADYEFDGLVDFVIDRLDGRNRLITIGGSNSSVISVDLSTGERSLFEPAPFGSATAWSIALDEQAKEVYFRYHSTILAQPLDGGASREMSYGGGGLVFTLDNLDEDLRVVVAGGPNGRDIIITTSALSEFTKLSPAPEDNMSLFGRSYGMTMDRVNGRYLVADATNQRVIAVDRTTGAQSIFSSSNDNVGSGDSFGEKGVVGMGGVAVDQENSRAIIVEITSGKLFSIDLATGKRTLVSGPGIPNVDVILKEAYGIKINTPSSYAFVADNTLQGVVAVDLETGQQVVFSKPPTL